MSKIENTPHKPPVIFPQEQRLHTELGERLRLARKRRKLSNAVVSQRARISRGTLYKVEAGDPGATLGSYVRVGRKLQDLALEPSPAAKRRTVKSSPALVREEST